ncbi:MAG: transposase [Burkholderiales bacterium]|nr:transposase [Burkholderiales bacterium]
MTRARIEQLLLARRVGDPAVRRRTTDALSKSFSIMRTGSPWRDLPEELGIGIGSSSAALARERCLGACGNSTARRC